ncbi:MAG: radical SAM protein [Clostridia bacterium]|nr:radical SAM protein [Clostridia bacterium]
MYSRVYVEITNICNRNCSFCPGTTRPLRRMTLSEFDTVTDRLRGVTEYLYYHVMGEPLTHPDLPDFIRLAKEKGFKSAVTTNGTLLQKRGRELIEAGVYKVNISVHSFEDGEDATAHGEYLDQILDFADEASRNGVLTVLRLWNLDGHGEALGGNNARTLDYLRERFPDNDATPWKFSPRGARMRAKLHLEYGDRFEWPDRSADDRGSGVFCYGLKDHFAILCDGTVVPCCLDREGVINLGRIFDTPMEEILDSPRANAMREGFRRRCATEELCRRCGYARRF